MQRFQTLTEGGAHLGLTLTTTSTLAIDDAESIRMGILRLISEEPVVVPDRLSLPVSEI